MPNTVIPTEWGYISYTPSTDQDEFGQALRDFYTLLSGSPETDREETAICANGKFYILCGDWRDVLRGKTLKECLEIFRSNPDRHGYTSDTLEPDA